MFYFPRELMANFLIKCRTDYYQEIRYISQYIFEEVYGFNIEITDSNDKRIEITITSAGNKKKLKLANTLFSAPKNIWLKPDSLPETPLKKISTKNECFGENQLPPELPVIYGEALDNGSFFKIEKDNIQTGLDIFGSAFFMLTRYEELVKKDRDIHDRFPIEAALSYQEKFNEIPIVNCYIEILWRLIKRLWGEIERKKRDYRIFVSHDVDNPLSFAWQSFASSLRASAGDLLKRKKPMASIKRLLIFAISKTGYFNRQQGVAKNILRIDPGYNLDWIMNTNREFGIVGRFNFIAGHTGGKIDGFYSLEWNWIKDLLKLVDKFGGEIGLHPSYKTYKNPKATRDELDNLRNTLKISGIKQNALGGRQHFLRWSNPETWQNWEDAGLAYDSTLGFAECPGFRCGICYEYPVFNLLTRQQLKLRERPLIVMDASILDYAAGTFPQLKRETFRFSKIVKDYNGDFTLLHHNCRLVTEEAKAAYREVLVQIAKDA